MNCNFQEADDIKVVAGKSKEEASKLRDEAEVLAGRVTVTATEVDNQERKVQGDQKIIDSVSFGLK